MKSADISGPQIPTSFVGAASAGMAETTQVTRNLCAAAYNHPSFRDEVIHHLVDGRERVLAPSFGVDVVAVVWHCLRSRRIEAYREVAVVILYLVFLLTQTGPTLLVAYISAALRAPRWGSSYLRKRRLTGKASASPRPAHYLVMVALALNAILAPLAYVLMLIAMAAPQATLFTARSPHDSAGARLVTTLVDAASGPALLALPALFAVVTLVVRAVRSRTGELVAESEDLRPALPPQASGALAWLQGPFTPALLRLRRQQLKTHLRYGSDVFLGAGLEHSSWSFATHLRPEKEGDAAAGPLLKNDQVIDAVRKGMLSFRQTDIKTGDRLSEIVVTDFVYSPSGHDAYVEEPEARKVAIASDEQVRHFLGIRVGSWDDDVIVSTFVRPSTHGDILYLEVIVHVLLPVDMAYRRPVDRVERGVNRYALLDVPANIARATPRNIWQLIRSTIASIREDNDREGENHPIYSLRHEAAAWRHDHYFQRLDAERYVKTVERRIVSSIKDLLREKKISADEFAAAANQVINNGIMISGGTFMRNNFATGSHAEQHQEAQAAASEATPAPAAQS
ncbi:hypothetical protein [Streptomyces sp. NPDC050988]|uniref:hypothetical protein n=1 Tax=Streptomyces sp. NPDC050988 TaxID=3365637 RepID=UPI0037AE17FD